MTIARGRRRFAAGLAACAAGTARLARAAATDDAALRAASGPGWAPWPDATPSLALPDLAGRAHTLRDFAGQVVIVNVWATWCEPCRDEIPAMSALAASRQADGLRLLAINSGESRQKIETFLGRWKVEGTVLWDRRGSVARDWRVIGMPANYLVDREGRLRWWHLGALDWTRGPVLAPVAALLKD